MIDIRKLKELVRLMVENELSELDLKDQEETVTIKRGVPGGVPVMIAPPSAAPARAAVPAGDDGSETGDNSGAAAEADTAGLLAITSPMVGTFYSSPNPDAGPFVSVGAAVSPETVVCLIEAMKVFNEIKADVSGTVERVLVKNGTAVEFGQKLYMIKPS